jgi:hypothetical protein
MGRGLVIIAITAKFGVHIQIGVYNSHIYSGGAQYVICRVKVDEGKSKTLPIWVKKMVLAQHNCTICSGWQKGTAMYLLQKRVR